VSAGSMVVGRRPPQQATTAVAVEFRKIVNQDDLSTASMNPVRSGSSPARLRMSTLSARPSIVWPRFKEWRIRPRKTPACRLAGTRPSQTPKSAPAIKASRAGPHAGVCSRSMAMRSSRVTLRPRDSKTGDRPRVTTAAPLW
jgi:hypothetical protein